MAMRLGHFRRRANQGQGGPAVGLRALRVARGCCNLAAHHKDGGAAQPPAAAAGVAVEQRLCQPIRCIQGRDGLGRLTRGSPRLAQCAQNGDTRFQPFDIVGLEPDEPAACGLRARRQRDGGWDLAHVERKLGLRLP